MSQQITRILSRLPAHLEPTHSGKLLRAVADGLGVELAPLSSALGGVRRAHRVGHAETWNDLLLVAGLHGLSAQDFRLPLQRATRMRAAASGLMDAVNAGDATTRDALATSVFTELGCANPSAELERFAPVVEGTPADLDFAARRLARALKQHFGQRWLLGAVRDSVIRLSRLHAKGNGTVYALIEAAAAALDLELDLLENRRLEPESRPDPSTEVVGAPSRTSWAYVVVARPLVRNMMHVSRVVRVQNGPETLSGENYVKLSWPPAADARDFLVYRVSAGPNARTGLLTASPLARTTLEFLDTGQEPASDEGPPDEVRDAILHSRDRFWHASYVREREPFMRRIQVTHLANRVEVPGVLKLAELALQLATPAATILERAAELASDARLDARLARSLVRRIFVAINPQLRPREESTLSAVATTLGASKQQIFEILAGLVTEEQPLELWFDAAGLEPLAASFGRMTVETDVIGIGERTYLDDLALASGVALDELTNALRSLGVRDAPSDMKLSRSEARRVVSRFSFRTATLRTLPLQNSVTLGALSRLTGIEPPRLVQDLLLMGVASPSALTLLSPRTVAQLLHRHHFAVMEVVGEKQEVLGIEENPRQVASWPPQDSDVDALSVRHAELFATYRGGFGAAQLEVRVTGVGQRTVGPMLVNRDEGRGVGFAGQVPAGQTLVFDEDGRATLDGVDVTDRTYSWHGACFAGQDDDPIAPRDFVFDGPEVPEARRAVFAVATPEGALEPESAFPHTYGSVATPGIGLGKTRYAFFAHEGHWSDLDAVGSPRPPAPRPKVGFASPDSEGLSVFHPGAASRQTAAELELRWFERKAYSVRVLISPRFLEGSAATGPTLKQQLRQALERVRPAGVEVVVEYQDERWLLGTSPFSTETRDPIVTIMGGTELWPTPP